MFVRVQRAYLKSCGDLCWLELNADMRCQEGTLDNASFRQDIRPRAANSSCNLLSIQYNACSFSGSHAVRITTPSVASRRTRGPIDNISFGAPVWPVTNHRGVFQILLVFRIVWMIWRVVLPCRWLPRQRYLLYLSGSLPTVCKVHIF